jgi:hypothetical protein
MSAAIVRALKASLGNPEALAALAQVEEHIAQAPGVRSQIELSDLIDAWGQTLVGIDAAELKDLKRQLRSTKILEDSTPRLQ